MIYLWGKIEEQKYKVIVEEQKDASKNSVKNNSEISICRSTHWFSIHEITERRAQKNKTKQNKTREMKQ